MKEVSKQALEIRTQAIEASVAAVEGELSYQLQGYTLGDGQPIRELAQIAPIYHQVIESRKKLSQQSAIERAAVRAADTLWVVSKATEIGAITSAQEAERLASAMMFDSHVSPGSLLQYLKGTSAHLERRLTGHELAGALELHAEINDDMLVDDTVVSVPTVVRASELCGIDLSHEGLVFDDEASQVVAANIRRYEFTRDITRADADGEIIHEQFRISTSKAESDATKPALLFHDEFEDFLAGRGWLAGLIADEGASNTGDILLDNETQSYLM